ncbi:MAG: rod shape-determining protein MreC [Firmicutes bacterium]|nr:rod shape-determining protein MreC [Bacillota bacterium]MCL5039422.1 rod shape-determining protein MreC [Bacillota bacterium]
MGWLHRHRWVLMATVLLGLLLWTIGATRGPRTSSTWPESLLGDLLSPLQGGIARAAWAVQKVWQGAAQLTNLRAENETLRKQMEELSAVKRELAEKELENQRLRQLLNFATSSGYPTVMAAVTGRSADSWFNQIAINRGARDGIAPNMVVVTSQGVVGRVIRVTERTAAVLLLTDPESGIGAMVQRSRDTGVVAGELGSTSLMMKFFSREADVAPGDVIMSSGLNSYYPKGLIIGEVVKVGRSDYGLVKFAQIKPSVDLNRLEEVLVITRGPGS